MSVRAIQAKVICDRATLESLWRTHRVFNERLPRILSLMFRMRRGECGETPELMALYQRIGQFITSYSAQNADYLMNAITMRGWKPGSAKKYKIKKKDANGETVEISGDTWADEAAALSAKGAILCDKQDLAGDLPACMRQMLNREAVAIISGHDELVSNWSADHDRWLAEKANWESTDEHRRYLALRPKFEEFEKSIGGKVGKRRGRWHFYLDWLRANPQLAAWRGGQPTVNNLSSQALALVKKAKPWKTRSVEAEEFWRVNPELAALDKLHGYYEREFVRRRKTKRNPDGFDHRPTFTVPDAVRHPRWFVFNAPQTNPAGYSSLALPDKPGEAGSIQLCLLTGEKGQATEYPTAWVPIDFRADRRLARFRRVKVGKIINRGKSKGAVKEKVAYEFFDSHLMRWRPAEISGVKLILRHVTLNKNLSLKTAVPYLIFTISTADLPLTENAKKIEWSDTGQITKTGKRRKTRMLPAGLTACAVDLGLRHAGFATLAVYEDGRPRVLRSRNIWLDPDGGGPDLGHIGRHKRTIRKLRRLRGKPIKGEESHIELQSHITHMGEDRFKKAARGIINFAWNTDGKVDKRNGEMLPRADVILIEKLEGFIPDAEKERGVNRSLAAWNRGQLVNRLKEMAVDCGYKARVFEIPPHGTSQVCSRCGAMGRRYCIAHDEDTGCADIRFGWVEKLFACPKCQYCANSDHNASVNLHRKFLLGDAAVAAFFDWRNLPEVQRRGALDAIDEQLRDNLRKKHKLQSDVETPF
jgi:hypothetical protein